tara:strand:- start:1158 stop:1724 length:567 start_codon:yes stop_codon:yes gene_type:complete
MSEIKKKLNSFKNLGKKDMFNEFMFCLLTPQSNAQRCWQAVLELNKLKNPSLSKIKFILKTRTRFHNVKSIRIFKAKSSFKNIKSQLNNSNTQELRQFIADNVSGYGLKEASHFLRNIGLSNNKIAILDRHILKNLYQKSLIKEPKIKSKKNYLEIEQTFLNHAKSINTPADELDLLWWSRENGEIFK